MGHESSKSHLQLQAWDMKILRVSLTSAGVGHESSKSHLQLQAWDMKILRVSLTAADMGHESSLRRPSSSPVTSDSCSILTRMAFSLAWHPSQITGNTF